MVGTPCLKVIRVGRILKHRNPDPAIRARVEPGGTEETEFRAQHVDGLHFGVDCVVVDFGIAVTLGDLHTTNRIPVLGMAGQKVCKRGAFIQTGQRTIERSHVPPRGQCLLVWLERFVSTFGQAWLKLLGRHIPEPRERILGVPVDIQHPGIVALDCRAKIRDTLGPVDRKSRRLVRRHCLGKFIDEVALRFQQQGQKLLLSFKRQVALSPGPEVIPTIGSRRRFRVDMCDQFGKVSAKVR